MNNLNIMRHARNAADYQAKEMRLFHDEFLRCLSIVTISKDVFGLSADRNDEFYKCMNGATGSSVTSAKGRLWLSDKSGPCIASRFGAAKTFSLLRDRVKGAIQCDPVVIDAFHDKSLNEKTFDRSKLSFQMDIPGRRDCDIKDTDIVEVRLIYEKDLYNKMEAVVFFRLDENGNLALMDKEEVDGLERAKCAIAR